MSQTDISKFVNLKIQFYHFACLFVLNIFYFYFISFHVLFCTFKLKLYRSFKWSEPCLIAHLKFHCKCMEIGSFNGHLYVCRENDSTCPTPPQNACQKCRKEIESRDKRENLTFYSFLFFLFCFFNTIDFLRHAPCMLHVQNKYEKCSRIYQDSLQNLPDPSPNATNLALDAVCWYVIARIYFFVPSSLFHSQPPFPLSLSLSYKNATRVSMHRVYHSLNINPFWFTSIYFQLFSRIRNMHGAHRLVAFFLFSHA